MSRRRSSKQKQREKPSTVLVYGESDNDTKALKEFMIGLKPSLAGKVQTRREPLVLIKNARPEEVKSRAERITNAVKAERVRYEVNCVFAHEDCDDLEPAHLAVCKKIEDALHDAGCPSHSVVPAWEMEAWFFLWPEAVQAVSKSWRLPDDYRGRHVGKIKDAKEELKRKVVPHGIKKQDRQHFREYEESDAPTIARNVRERGEVNTPAGRSDSYERFRQSVQTCSD